MKRFKLKLNTTIALVSFLEMNATEGVTSFHFGVKPDRQLVYKYRNGQEIEVECNYIWGRATEIYDHCLEYFGLGPLFLICWR